MVRIDRKEEGEARVEKAQHLARRYGRIRQEIERLKAMDKALAEVPDGQISLTDADAVQIVRNMIREAEEILGLRTKPYLG